jgi:hypothetical protein
MWNYYLCLIFGGKPDENQTKFACIACSDRHLPPIATPPCVPVIGQKRPLRHEGATGVVDTSDVQPFSFGVHGWENQASISVNADEGDRDDSNLPTDGHPAICETLPLENSNYGLCCFVRPTIPRDLRLERGVRHASETYLGETRRWAEFFLFFRS